MDRLIPSRDDQQLMLRYRDMGDGTWAEVLLVQSANAGGYPVGATQVNASASTGGNTPISASLPAVLGKTNYITGFEITGSGATLAASVLATVTGVLGGTLTYVAGVVSGILAANPPIIVQFARPVQAAAANQAVTLTLPALGLGNNGAAVNLHGFVL
jgi:hypothetical protein